MEMGGEREGRKKREEERKLKRWRDLPSVGSLNGYNRLQQPGQGQVET